MRYAVVHHGGIDRPHMDLFVEPSAGAPLATWRLANWPVKGDVPAERLADHRNLYLSYEGPLSDHRGFVRQVEAGECDLVIERSEDHVDHETWRLTVECEFTKRELTLTRVNDKWSAHGVELSPGTKD